MTWPAGEPSSQTPAECAHVLREECTTQLLFNINSRSGRCRRNVGCPDYRYSAKLAAREKPSFFRFVIIILNGHFVVRPSHSHQFYDARPCSRRFFFPVPFSSPSFLPSFPSSTFVARLGAREAVKFTLFNHRHKCRKCQEPVCNSCSRARKVSIVHLKCKSIVN